MSDDLAPCLTLYIQMVPMLLEYEDDEEVVGALLWRDAIAEALSAGASLSGDDARRLFLADCRVLADRAQLVERFPSVFIDRAPRDLWRWHLEKPEIVAAAEHSLRAA